MGNEIKRVGLPLLKVGLLLFLLKFALVFFQFGAFLFKGGDLAQAGGWLGGFFVQKIESGQITSFDVFLLAASVAIVISGLAVFGIFRVLWGLAKEEDWLALATTTAFIVAIIATDFGQSLPVPWESFARLKQSGRIFDGFGAWLALPFLSVGQLIIKAVDFVLTVLIAISAFGFMCWPILLPIGIAAYFLVKRKKGEAGGAKQTAKGAVANTVRPLSPVSPAQDRKAVSGQSADACCVCGHRFNFLSNPRACEVCGGRFCSASLWQLILLPFYSIVWVVDWMVNGDVSLNRDGCGWGVQTGTREVGGGGCGPFTGEGSSAIVSVYAYYCAHHEAEARARYNSARQKKG